MRWVFLGLAGFVMIALGALLMLDGRTPSEPAATPLQALAMEEPPATGTLSRQAMPTMTQRVFPTDTPTTTPTLTLTSSALRAVCTNAHASRLDVGMYAFVSFDPPLANRVRAEPGTQGRAVGRMEPGIVMLITGGPQCANNWVWWQIRTNDGLVGWTAEGDQSTYWLVPCRDPAGTECY